MLQAPPKNRFFVTGTDTDAGKTLVTVAFLTLCKRLGHSVAGMKPIAAGATLELGRWVNEDALQLLEAGSSRVPYEVINPFCFAPPIAPHIAARLEGIPLTAQLIAERCTPFLNSAFDYGFIEGAGGWRVPLNETETYADVVAKLKLPVILVVGLKLGCLNHALLTMEAIEHDGLQLAGWVGNQVHSVPMSRMEENLDSLRERLSAPCLGIVPFIPAGNLGQEAAGYISLPKVTELPA